MLDDATPGPGGLPPTSSLRSRRSPLADPETQIATLDALDLEDEPFAGDFAAAVLGHAQKQDAVDGGGDFLCGIACVYRNAGGCSTWPICDAARYDADVSFCSRR